MRKILTVFLCLFTMNVYSGPSIEMKMAVMKAAMPQLPVPPPAGLFGIYSFPKKGQGIAGINFAHIEFSGLIQGDSHRTAEEVVTTIPNRFFGQVGQPPILRLVPKKFQADIVLPYINVALNERVAFVAVAPYIRKETKIETFQGPAGAVSLGVTTINSSGWGDVKAGLLVKVFNDNTHRVLINTVLSMPTGSITEDGFIRSPMNVLTRGRLGYGMQLGSGTWDALVGVSYWGKKKQYGWGVQYLATIPLESDNSEGWRFGDKHEGTAWLSYSWKPTLVTSVRIKGGTQDAIHGVSSDLVSPGLGADPDNYGRDQVEVGVGVNWTPMMGQNLSLELMKPIYQDVNGVQLEQDYSLYGSWRMGFL